MRRRFPRQLRRDGPQGHVRTYVRIYSRGAAAYARDIEDFVDHLRRRIGLRRSIRTYVGTYVRVSIRPRTITYECTWVRANVWMGIGPANGGMASMTLGRDVRMYNPEQLGDRIHR